MKERIFIYHVIVRTFIMFGFTYFSVAIATQAWLGVKASLIASGLYLFTELMRRYKIEKTERMHFLI